MRKSWCTYVILIVTVVFAAHLQATSITYTVMSDTDFVEYAEIIVQGEIVEITNVDDIDPYCFSQLYKFRTTKEELGENLDEIITVAIATELPKFHVGQKQLLVLSKMPKDFLDYCDEDLDFLDVTLDEIYRDSSTKVSVFNIDSSCDNLFKVYHCEGKYSKIFAENSNIYSSSYKYSSGGLDCEVYEGKLDRLLDKIRVYMGQ